MLMRAATVVQVLQDLFYVLLHVLFYLWSLPYSRKLAPGDEANKKHQRHAEPNTNYGLNREKTPQ